MPKPRVVTIADKVRAARTKLNLTQLELARLAGVRPETINRIETGRSPASLASLHKLAPVLGLSLDELAPRPGAPMATKKRKGTA